MFMCNEFETSQGVKVDGYLDSSRWQLNIEREKTKTAFHKLRAKLCNKYVSIEVRQRVSRGYMAPILL